MFNSDYRRISTVLSPQFAILQAAVDGRQHCKILVDRRVSATIRRVFAYISLDRAEARCQYTEDIVNHR